MKGAARNATSNSGLITMARAVGSTLGRVVRTAEDVAEDVRGLRARMSPGAIRRRTAQTPNSEVSMPGTKRVRGAGSKEQRMYEHIKRKAQKSGRYGKRAKEVAARTVMKHHKSKGHAKGR